MSIIAAPVQIMISRSVRKMALVTDILKKIIFFAEIVIKLFQYTQNEKQTVVNKQLSNESRVKALVAF